MSALFAGQKIGGEIMKNYKLALLFVSMLAKNLSANDTCAILFEHANYGGAEYVINKNSANVSWVGNWWNDKVSSAVVMPGCHLTLFEHVNYGGGLSTYDGSESWVGDYWNDKASSFVCYCN